MRYLLIIAACLFIPTNLMAFGPMGVLVASGGVETGGVSAPTPDVQYRFENGALTTDEIGSLDLTSNGSPTANTSTYVEGLAAADLTDNTEYFTHADNAAFEPTTNDYWFAVRFRIPNVNQYREFRLFHKVASGNGLLIKTDRYETGSCQAISVGHHNSFNISTLLSSNCISSTDTWYHLQVSYDADGGSTSGGKLTVWLSTNSFGNVDNATEEDNVAYTPGDSSADLTIGSVSDSYNWFIDDWRFDVGATLDATTAEAIYDDI